MALRRSRTFFFSTFSLLSCFWGLVATAGGDVLGSCTYLAGSTLDERDVPRLRTAVRRVLRCTGFTCATCLPACAPAAYLLPGVPHDTCLPVTCCLCLRHRTTCCLRRTPANDATLSGAGDAMFSLHLPRQRQTCHHFAGCLRATPPVFAHFVTCCTPALPPHACATRAVHRSALHRHLLLCGTGDHSPYGCSTCGFNHYAGVTPAGATRTAIPYRQRLHADWFHCLRWFVCAVTHITRTIFFCCAATALHCPTYAWILTLFYIAGR